MMRKREYDEELLRITGHYVEEVEAGRQPQVSEYIHQYPQYAEAIADFVAYYHAIEVPLAHSENERGEGHETHLASTAQAALQTARKRVYASAQQASTRPIITLLKTGNNEQMTLTQLAAHLQLSEDMVMLLERRHLNANSIPLALQRRLAVWLRKPVSSIRQYFLIAIGDERNQRREPQARVAEKPLYYPATGKKDFLQALEESDEATEEQKAFWRACVTREQHEEQ